MAVKIGFLFTLDGAHEEQRSSSSRCSFGASPMRPNSTAEDGYGGGGRRWSGSGVVSATERSRQSSSSSPASRLLAVALGLLSFVVAGGRWDEEDFTKGRWGHIYSHAVTVGARKSDQIAPVSTSPQDTCSSREKRWRLWRSWLSDRGKWGSVTVY